MAELATIARPYAEALYRSVAGGDAQSLKALKEQAGALAALAARVKDSFDPRRILNPGRMVQGL